MENGSGGATTTRSRKRETDAECKQTRRGRSRAVHLAVLEVRHVEWLAADGAGLAFQRLARLVLEGVLRLHFILAPRRAVRESRPIRRLSNESGVWRVSWWHTQHPRPHARDNQRARSPDVGHDKTHHKRHGVLRGMDHEDDNDIAS